MRHLRHGWANRPHLPWKNSYAGAKLYGGKVEFVCSLVSGHVQSMVNPPGNPKSAYYVNDELMEKPPMAG